ncbi:hypothetical protein HMPREF0004_0988 [Achromobacter piechaudii ATCC 43553]|uniref:Uncharacterized protein n=1 Tax=Achromobacter piechaudii ATCC 43553 TaxID=742159 RepID=D4X626_9BURK|nr:hypothetical protein HMPREF0004_0988 [Achromobacter piechaudii ATCC 43553]
MALNRTLLSILGRRVPPMQCLTMVLMFLPLSRTIACVPD